MTSEPRLLLADGVLAAVNGWFEDAAALEVEDMVVLLGTVTPEGDRLAVTAFHPNLERHPGWYEQRLDDNWDLLYSFGMRHQLRLLAQVHTHPDGVPTRHSRRDDLGAANDQVGFLSLVVPDFGRAGLRLHDKRMTVHERIKTGWRVWPSQEARRRLASFPSTWDAQEDEHDG